MKNDHKEPIDKFENLFKTEHSRLTGHAYNLVRDIEVAKDIVQEVFYKLWKTKDRLDFSQNMTGYLFKATTNGALNYLKSPKRTLQVPVDIVSEQRSTASADPLEYNDLENAVRKAIDHLPPKCKVIYLLSRHEEMTNRQIADHLDVSLKTVENQMTIALRKLKLHLEHHLVEFIFVLLASSFLGWFLTLFMTG